MTARDRIIIAVVLMVAALGGFWFVGLAPKRKEATALQAQVDTATQKLADAQQMAAQARRAKASYDKDYAEVAKLGKAVPKSDALPSLLYQLQSAAHNARIDFRSLKINGSGAPGTTVAATPAAKAATTANGNPGGFPSVKATVSATAYVLAPGDVPSASGGAAGGAAGTPGTSAPAPTTSAPAATASEVAR